jgi:sugar-specific transcriptional regulator TrmB
VQVETVSGRPALYKVLDIHDVIGRPADEAA